MDERTCVCSRKVNYQRMTISAYIPAKCLLWW